MLNKELTPTTLFHLRVADLASTLEPVLTLKAVASVTNKQEIMKLFFIEFGGLYREDTMDFFLKGKK